MSSEILEEEYEVYAAVLTQRSSMMGRQRFVIGETVRAPELETKGGTQQAAIVHWMVKLRGLKEETVKDFLTRNRGTAAVLKPNFNLPLPYVLLSDAESAEIWDHDNQQKMRGGALDGWDVFHERYPKSGGVVRLSRVGFNGDRTQALLEMGVTAHWLMGHGAMVFLQKEPDGGWRIASELRTWIS